MEIVGIHNNIDPKPPMYIRVPTPEHFKSEEAQRRYWDKEFNKWHTGYSGLTGIHYFMLQECVIPNDKGAPIRPHFRDCDMEFFESWEQCERDKLDMMVIKRREIGLSTFGGGIIPIYKALTNEGSECVITSASQKRLQSMFRKKTEGVYDKLNPYYRQEKIRKTQSGNLFIGIEDRATKTFSGLQSAIWSIDTTKDARGFESYRIVYGFCDEIFLHPHAPLVRESAQGSTRKGFEKTACLLLGGTCGQVNTKGAQAGIELYNDSAKNGIAVLFLGGTKGIEQYSVNGWCDERKAEEHILKRREELSKSQNKTGYFEYLTQFPLSIEEVFNLVADCALPQEVQLTLNDAEKKIQTEKIVVGKYTMQSDSIKIIAQPDEMNGKIHIITPPVKGHVYLTGIDPIPFGNNSLGEGSDYALVVLDDTTKEPVAYYAERSFDSQMVVRNSVLLQRLYKSDIFPQGAPAMLELNRGEVVLKDYLAMGADKLLAPMPIHLGIVFEERKYPFGVYMNNQIAARCEALCMKFLLAHGYKLRFKELIQQFRYLSTKTNTDILDAFKMALLFSEELMEMRKKQTPVYQNHKIVQLVRDPVSHKLIRQEVDSSILQR